LYNILLNRSAIDLILLEKNMPEIHVINTGDTVKTDPVTSVLVALQRDGVQIESLCGGKARCGRCAIRIIEGNRFLSKKKQNEAKKLAGISAASDIRLACQTYTRGDIRIELINEKRRNTIRAGQT
jgi:adenylate cyclase